MSVKLGDIQFGRAKFKRDWTRREGGGGLRHNAGILDNEVRIVTCAFRSRERDPTTPEKDRTRHQNERKKETCVFLIRPKNEKDNTKPQDKPQRLRPPPGHLVR